MGYEDHDNKAEDDWEGRAREQEPPRKALRPGTRPRYITSGPGRCPRYPAHPVNQRADGAIYCHTCEETFYPADFNDFAAWVAALPEQREAA